MQFRLLGSLQVLDAKGVDVTPTAAKVRTLLALLLVRRGQVVSPDRIVDVLWGERPPQSAINLVQGYVRDLRRSVGTQLIETVPGGYRLSGTVSVDADDFVGFAEVGDVCAAMRCWRGPALAEWADEPWASGHVARLDEQRLGVLERRLTADIDNGRAAEVVGELAELVSNLPLRERLRVLYVKALYLCDRQVEALQACRDAYRMLRAEAGVEPGRELQDVQAAVLSHDPRLAAIGAGSPLPEATDQLVGREADVSELRRLLGVARLVTVCGPGGAGKTRLALAAAHDLGSAVFVDLVPTTDGASVVAAIASGLRVAGEDQVDRMADVLGDRASLLVLDNCEHVVESVADLVVRLLSRCSRLRILATSRTTLNAPGEHALPLAGLDPESAVTLFSFRARAANPRVRLPADAVRSIVQRLDGMPLAIELAAARTRSLTVEQVESELRRPLDLLWRSGGRGAPDRHRSMRVVLDWSHDLLAPPDREAFGALSVFLSPFTLDGAVELVGSLAPARVEHLIECGLLVRCPDRRSQAAYRMLAVVREYARERAGPALQAARARHLDYHVATARRIAAGLCGAFAPHYAKWARDSVEDFRAAVQFAIDTSAPIAGDLVADLYWPSFLDGNLSDLATWSPVSAIDLSTDTRTRARLLRVVASSRVARGDLAGAEAAAQGQLAAAYALCDDQLIALAHNLLGMIAWSRHDLDALRRHASAAENHARWAGQPWSLVFIIGLCGRAAHALGHCSRAAVLLAEAVERGEALGEPMTLGCALDYQSRALLAAGSVTLAERLGHRALHCYRQIGYQEGVASASTLVAVTAVLLGRGKSASDMLATAHDVCTRIGHVGGLATVLEASALMYGRRGDLRAAARSLADARTLRDTSATATPPELSGLVRHTEATVTAQLGSGALVGVGWGRRHPIHYAPGQGTPASAGAAG